MSLRISATDGVVVFVIFVLLWAVDSYFQDFWPYSLAVVVSYVVTDAVYVRMIRLAERQEEEFRRTRILVPFGFKQTDKLASGTGRFIAVFVAIMFSSFLGEETVTWLNGLGIQGGDFVSAFLPSLIIVLLVYFYFVHRYRATN